MPLSFEMIDGVCVVSPKGRLVLGGGDSELRETIRQQLGAGQDQFVIDLSDVTYIDSAGLGELIATLKRAREANGDVKIAGMRDKVKSLFVLTRLETAFDVHATVQDAIAAFADGD